MNCWMLQQQLFFLAVVLCKKSLWDWLLSIGLAEVASNILPVWGLSITMLTDSGLGFVILYVFFPAFCSHQDLYLLTDILTYWFYFTKLLTHRTVPTSQHQNVSSSGLWLSKPWLQAVSMPLQRHPSLTSQLSKVMKTSGDHQLIFGKSPSLFYRLFIFMLRWLAAISEPSTWADLRIWGQVPPRVVISSGFYRWLGNQWLHEPVRP